MGFGYRAKFIVNTVKALQEKAEQANGDQSGMTPEEWLIKLRSGERDWRLRLCLGLPLRLAMCRS